MQMHQLIELDVTVSQETENLLDEDGDIHYCTADPSYIIPLTSEFYYKFPELQPAMDEGFTRDADYILINITIKEK
jgi:hypothetical protein